MITTCFVYFHRWARVLGQGGGRHRGVSSKKFSGRLRRPKNFSPAPPPGGEIFFSVGGLFSRPGGDFAQKSQKMASPGGQNFFSPGCTPSRVFFAPGVGQIFGLRGGAPPPPTPPRAHLWLLQTLILGGGCYFTITLLQPRHGYCKNDYATSQMRLTL